MLAAGSGGSRPWMRVATGTVAWHRYQAQQFPGLPS
jgi:hypothetical protein